MLNLTLRPTPNFGYIPLKSKGEGIHFKLFEYSIDGS